MSFVCFQCFDFSAHSNAFLAKQVGILEENILVVENGEVVELVDGKLKKGERIPGGYVFVDGQSIGDVDHGVMREREKLSRSGIFLVDLNVDKYSGRLLGEPEILTRGFLSPDDANELLPEVRKRIMDIVNGGGLDAEKDISSAVKSKIITIVAVLTSVYTILFVSRVIDNIGIFIPQLSHRSLILGLLLTLCFMLLLLV